MKNLARSDFFGLCEHRKIFFFCFVFHLFLYIPFLFAHESLAFGLSSLILTLCLIRLFLFNEIKIFQRLSLRGFSFLHKFLSLFCFVLLVYYHKEFRTLETGMSLLSVLAPLKLLEARNPRDYFVYLMIGMLLFLSQLLSMNTLWVVFYSCIACIFLFYLLNLISVWSESIESSQKVSQSLSGSFNFKKVLLLFAYALPLTTLLFLFFPRVSVGNLFFSIDVQTGVTGFSERLRPGEVSEIVQGDDVAFRVMSGEGGFPDLRDLYWRGNVLVENDGLNWDLPSDGSSLYQVQSSSSNRSRRYFSISKEQGYEEGLDYRLSMANVESSPIFHLENSYSFKALTPGRITKKNDETFSFEAFNNQAASFDMIQGEFEDIETRGPQREHLSYPLRFNELERLEIFLQEFREDFQGDTLEVQRDTSQIVERLMHVYTENEFHYTLTPGSYLGDNGFEEFFFERRVGFCEHYAAATGLILRMLGIPSRVVVGFHGGQYNDHGGYYIISSRDAHAWVEFWDFTNEKWGRIDPTSFIAPSRVERGAEYFLLSLDSNIPNFDEYFLERENSFFSNLTHRLDAFYFLMSQRFLGYDLEAQMRFMRSLGLRFNTESHLFWASVLIAIVLCLALILALFFVVFSRLYKKRAVSAQERLNNSYRKFVISCQDFFDAPSEGPSLEKTPFENLKILKCGSESFSIDSDKLSKLTSMIDRFVKLSYSIKMSDSDRHEIESLIKDFNSTDLSK